MVGGPQLGWSHHSQLQMCLCYSELKLDSLQRSSGHASFPSPLSRALSFSQLACGDRAWHGSSEFMLRG